MEFLRGLIDGFQETFEAIGRVLVGVDWYVLGKEHIAPILFMLGCMMLIGVICILVGNYMASRLGK